MYIGRLIKKKNKKRKKGRKKEKKKLSNYLKRKGNLILKNGVVNLLILKYYLQLLLHHW